MQFSIAALFALFAAVAIAQPVTSGEPVVRRQVKITEAAMTDADGNVVPYDGTKVNLPMAESGQ